MSPQNALSNQFLVAMPSMANPWFDRTVSYICDHNAQGAMGFVINRPINITVGELLTQVDIKTPRDCRRCDDPVYFGGPVERGRGFVLHAGAAEWGASTAVTEELAITTSPDILQAIGRGEGPEKFLLLLGYAGWGPGQLESEMLENAWLSTPADTELIFAADCADSWRQAARLIGVDVELMSGQAGHA